jgi:hypothetical protein
LRNVEYKAVRRAFSQGEIPLGLLPWLVGDQPLLDSIATIDLGPDSKASEPIAQPAALVALGAAHDLGDAHAGEASNHLGRRQVLAVALLAQIGSDD